MDNKDEERPQGPPVQDTNDLVTTLTPELAQVNLAELSGSSTVESSNPNLIDRGTNATASLQNLIDLRMSTSNSTNHIFPSHHENEHLVYHDDEGGSLPLPGFLSDSCVGMALRRAGALPLQRTLHEALSSHPSPVFDERSHFPSERERGTYVAADFHPSLGPSGYPHLPFSAPYSSSPLSPRGTVVAPPSIPEKFVPGNESASVLKITKRPKLRPKDLLHRRSLEGNAAPLDMQANEVVDISNHGEPMVPFSSPEHPSRYVPREVRPATGAWERPLMVQLFCRGQQVIVPAHAHMSVDAFQQIAAFMVGGESASFRLMSGDTLLRLGTYLEDYPGHIGHFGMHTVPSATNTPPVRSSPHPADLSTAGHAQSPTLTSTSARISDRPPTLMPTELLFRPRALASNEPSFLILLEFEDGRTATQVVWPSMPIRHLCVQIGELAHVPHDTVFCYFAGSVLDNERCIADPPAIGDGARVYVFFSIGRALRFVIHSLQGGHPPSTPPPATPPQGPPAPFGPVVPPGFTRHPPTTTPALPGNTTHHTSASTSDRLRNTFKCPKFFG
jgi:hypothetical protein